MMRMPRRESGRQSHRSKTSNQFLLGPRPRRLNVGIFGDASCGKTSLLKALAGEAFNPNEPPTNGADQKEILLSSISDSVGNYDCEVILKDMGSQNISKEMWSVMSRNVHLIIYLVDVTQLDTTTENVLHMVSQMMIANDLKQKLIVVGNKSDLVLEGDLPRIKKLFEDLYKNVLPLGPRRCYISVKTDTNMDVFRGELSSLLSDRLHQIINDEGSNNNIGRSTKPFKAIVVGRQGN